MKITCRHLTLPLRHTFTLGNKSSRTHTPISIIEISHHGHTAYGEAAMPPYLGESHSSVDEFLIHVDAKALQPDQPGLDHSLLEQASPGNTAAKAAIDIALHDLRGKLSGQPLRQLLGITAPPKPSTFTIGICTGDLIRKKTEEGLNAGFRQFKAKLGGGNDREMIREIRKATDLPLFVDVNQGWNNKEEALEKICWLQEMGVLFVEQPFPKNDLQSQSWLVSRSPLPVFADEACQRLSDLEHLKELYHGVNVKLMKCTGIFEAMQIREGAQKLGLKTMIGCMTETSCATLAAAAIAPLFDFVDLDGPWMLAEQPFETPAIKDGIIEVTNLPGLGLVLSS